jgi:hypothetical protein
MLINHDQSTNQSLMFFSLSSLPLHTLVSPITTTGAARTEMACRRGTQVVCLSMMTVTHFLVWHRSDCVAASPTHTVHAMTKTRTGTRLSETSKQTARLNMNTITRNDSVVKTGDDAGQAHKYIRCFIYYVVCKVRLCVCLLIKLFVNENELG